MSIARTAAASSSWSLAKCGAHQIADGHSRIAHTTYWQLCLDELEPVVDLDPVFQPTHHLVDIVDLEWQFLALFKSFDQSNAVLPVVHITFGVRAFDHDLLAVAKELDDALLTCLQDFERDPAFGDRGDVELVHVEHDTARAVVPPADCERHAEQRCDADLDLGGERHVVAVDVAGEKDAKAQADRDARLTFRLPPLPTLEIALLRLVSLPAVEAAPLVELWRVFAWDLAKVVFGQLAVVSELNAGRDDWQDEPHQPAPRRTSGSRWVGAS